MKVFTIFICALILNTSLITAPETYMILAARCDKLVRLIMTNIDTIVQSFRVRLVVYHSDWITWVDSHFTRKA